MPDIEKSLRKAVEKGMERLRAARESPKIEKVTQVVEKGGRAARAGGGFLAGIGKALFGTEEFNIPAFMSFVLSPFRYVILLIAKYLKVILCIASFFGLIYLLTYFSADIWVWMARGTHCKVGDIGCVAGGGITNMGRGISSYKQSLADLWDMQIKKATGQYYLSENENERIGVYLTDVQPGAPIFGVNEPIIVYAELRGEVLEEDLDNPVTVNCVMKGKMDEIPAEHVEPKGLVLADLQGSGEGIDCQFPAYTSQDQITEVAKTVDVTAEFQFTGKGRVVLNFMDDNVIREMRREDKDPNDVYNIPRVPQAYYSGGPMMIGIGTTRTNPIGLKSDGGDITTRLGLTLQNNWEGEIVRINRIEIMPEPGITLPQESNVLKLSPIANGYSVDEIYLPTLTDDGNKTIKTFISLNFRMALDRDGLLKPGTPVTQKEVQIVVEYTYRMKASTVVQLDYIPPLPALPANTTGAATPPTGPPGTTPPNIVHPPEPCIRSELKFSGVPVTHYYIPYESQFPTWEAFAAAVKMQGTGKGNNGLYYRYYSVDEKKSYTREEVGCIIKVGCWPQVGRTIAVNFNYIESGEKVYVEMGNSPWTGVYIAEDTGSAFAGPYKGIDIFTGEGPTGLHPTPAVPSTANIYSCREPAENLQR